MAIDLQTMSILWTQEFPGKVLDDIMTARIDGKNKILTLSNGKICLLDAMSGAIEYELNTNSAIVNLIAVDESKFLGLDKNGTYIAVDFSKNTYYEMEYLLECKLDKIQNFYTIPDGCLIQTDNRIVLYRAMENQDKVEYEGEVEDSRETQADDNAIDKAKALGVSEYRYTETVIYSDDDQYAFVSLQNSVLEIYDMNDKSLINRIENIQDPLMYYLGTDNAGNMYVASENKGYCIDSEYNLIATIENLIGVDKEANRLVVWNDDKVWSIPIYSTDELVDMAKTMLDE